MSEEKVGGEETEEEVEEIPTKIFVVQVPKTRNIDLLELIRVRTELMRLPIYSAFIVENYPDIVFVEADNPLAVTQAVMHFKYAKSIEESITPYESKRVIDILVEALTVEREVEEEKKVELEIGQIVRIIRGPFKDKKARIVSVTKNKLFVDLMSGATLLIEVDPEDVEIITE